ncbi:prepilin peptidase [Brooklawnia cerclae]|uniref:Leader peptidase (Prepilin peptidase)/N-methyltransferase n=1 Tax=Brooklawnia cerclae TaxID=349934 RepID=A0ABX0SGN0_9ACTN|nr:prepilin peptidase [Brooklawnia cerclae]NIH57557.1 leader peptidase (prepilin peptidase)/N-methyltransferase [Brooklawnia cerclae]
MTATALTATQLLIVRHHPEPDDITPDVEHKPRYAAMVGPRMIVGCLLVAAAASALAIAMPPAARPVWVAWGSSVMVLVVVDARSTWLPARATILAGASVVTGLAAGALITPTGALPHLLHAGVGSLVAGLLFALLWWTSGSLGFGDVWLAAMVGGLSAAMSPGFWYVSLFAGSAAAAAWGGVTMLLRRRRPSPLGTVFAYGPGLWLGPYCALAWTTLPGVSP